MAPHAPTKYVFVGITFHLAQIGTCSMTISLLLILGLIRECRYIQVIQVVPLYSNGELVFSCHPLFAMDMLLVFDVASHYQDILFDQSVTI